MQFVLALYAVFLIQTYRSRRDRGDSVRNASLYAVFAMLSKFAAIIGISMYWKRRFLRQRASLIEYKVPLQT